MDKYLEEYTKLGEIHYKVLEEIEEIEARLRMIFLDDETTSVDALKRRLDYLEEKQGKLEKRLDYLETKCYN